MRERMGISRRPTWERRFERDVFCLRINASCLRLQALFLLYLIVEDHDNLFVVAEVAHFTGIAILLYKLIQEETCSGAYVYTRSSV